MGVIKLAADPTKQPLLTVDVQGIPREWDGEDVVAFLQSEQWVDVVVLNRRRAGRSAFRWTVRGKPPLSNLGGPWSYVDHKDAQWSVLVSKVARSARAPESVSVKPLGRQPFCSGDHAEGQEKQEQRAPQENRGPFSLSSKENQNGTGDEDSNGRHRSRSPKQDRKADAPSGLAKAAPNPQVSGNNVEWLESQGWKRVNNGGNGDCGFRKHA